MERLDAWHKTRVGYLVFGVVELVLCYAIGSLAIDSGSLLEYVLAFILLFGVIRNFVKFVQFDRSKKHVKSGKQPKKA